MMGTLLSLVVLSVREPRVGLRALLSSPLGEGGRMSLFLLAAILPTLLIFLVLGLAPMPEGVEAFPVGPLALLVVQGSVLLLMAALIWRIGRWRGGIGSFGDSVVALSWLQVVMVAAQVAFVVLELALPFLGAIMGIVAVALMFWLLTNFVAEVHGFTSLPLVFLGVVVTLLALTFVLGFLSSLLLGAGHV